MTSSHTPVYLLVVACSAALAGWQPRDAVTEGAVVAVEHAVKAARPGPPRVAAMAVQATPPALEARGPRRQSGG